MSNIILRPDQQILKDGIYNSWNTGNRNVLAVLSTGGGKSVVCSKVSLDVHNAGEGQAIIAHRNELVGQMSCHIAREGIPHRIIGSEETVRQIVRQHRKLFNYSFVNPSARTAVIGVDTLIARQDNLIDWGKQISRWTIDEAHHVLRENKWGKAVNMFPNAYGLGLTATPGRPDGQGLGRDYDGVFDDMIIGIGMRELIGIQALSDYEIVCPTSDIEVQDSDVSASGDWSNQKLRTAAKKSHIVGDVVKNYILYASGRRAICFATDVETATDIANKFKEAGIPAASVSAKTNSAVREKYVDDFKEGKLTVLVNVDLFDEGFDTPACDVVIMARPTASIIKYRQQVGRALRYVPGKVALIIDHVSNIVRHGLPDKKVAWTLARRDKRAKSKPDPDEIGLRACVRCTKPYEKFRVACPYCGAVPPLPEPRSRSVAVVEGDLVLLTREKLEQMRQAMICENPGDVAERVAKVAGEIAGKGAIKRQLEKIEAHDRLKHTIAQWAAIEREKGFNDREIQRKFYLTLGVDVLTAMDASQTRAELDQLSNTIEGWYECRK